MTRTYESNEQMMDVVRQVLWNAWRACGGPQGSGYIQDRPEATRDQVFECAFHKRDYPGGRFWTEQNAVDADYVFGRMMKLYMKLNHETNTITVPLAEEYPPTTDYNGWARKYPTYEALFDAAESDLRPTDVQF